MRGQLGASADVSSGAVLLPRAGAERSSASHGRDRNRAEPITLKKLGALSRYDQRQCSTLKRRAALCASQRIRNRSYFFAAIGVPMGLIVGAEHG